MARSMLASIERICPKCGTSNRILTSEIKPYWKINCSHCGEAIAERRAFRPVMMQQTGPSSGEPRKVG